MDNLFETLQISVVHVGLHEVGARPLVHVAQGGCLELAVEGSAYCFHSELTLAGPLKKSPTPLSTKLRPTGLERIRIGPAASRNKTEWRGFWGRPRLFEVKSVKRGATLAAFAGAIAAGVRRLAVFSVPSKWHVLHIALPRNRFQPANSSRLNTDFPRWPARNRISTRTG